MSVDRISVTMARELGVAARKEARLGKVSLSAFIAEATAAHVRNEALGRALDQWEREEGAFTKEELEAAEAALGLVYGAVVAKRRTRARAKRR